MSETLTRACGHTMEFVPAGDRFDDARRDKIRRKRCGACGLAKNAEDNARQGGSRKVKKGDEVKALPCGIVVRLTLAADGWHGDIAAGGVTAETHSAGAMGILSKLARKWLAANGARLRGIVKE